MPQKLKSVRAADTLLILDCSYASRAHHSLETYLKSPTNAVVMLAATTDDNKAMADGKFTFTTNVRKQFEDLVDTEFAVSDFYTGLRIRARRWRQGVDDDCERRCIHVPHRLTTYSTDDRSMVLSSISWAEPAYAAPPPPLQAVEKRGQGDSQVTQAKEAFQCHRRKMTPARRASIDSDSTVYHSSDSEIDWEAYKSSPTEPVYELEPPKAQKRHSPSPEPPSAFKQFLPDNVGSMDESDTRDGPEETHNASTDWSGGVDVLSRTSTPDKWYHPDAPRLEEFLSQWNRHC